MRTLLFLKAISTSRNIDGLALINGKPKVINQKMQPRAIPEKLDCEKLCTSSHNDKKNTWDYIFSNSLLLSTIFDFIDENDFLNFINYLKDTEHRNIIENGDSRYDIWNGRCFNINLKTNDENFIDLLKYLIEYILSPQPSYETPEVKVYFNAKKFEVNERIIRMISRIKYLTFSDMLFTDTQLNELLTSPYCKIETINFINCNVKKFNQQNKKELEIINSTVRHLKVINSNNVFTQTQYSFINLQLPNLQSLIYDSYRFLNNDFLLKHKDFITKIDINSGKIKSILLSAKNFTMPTVTTLTIDQMNEKTIYTTFPNMKHLTITDFSSNCIVNETVETLVLSSVIDYNLDLKQLLRYIHLNNPKLKHLVVTDNIVTKMIANRYNEDTNIIDFIYPLETQIKQLLEITVIYTEKAHPLILDALKREINIISPYTYVKFKLATKREIDLGYGFYYWKPFSEKAEQLLRKVNEIICKTEITSIDNTLTKSFIERYVACAFCEETINSFYRLNLFTNYTEKENTCRYYYFEKTLAKRKKQYEIYKDTFGFEDELAVDLRLKVEAFDLYLKMFDCEILSDLQLTRKDLKKLYELQKEMEDLSHKMYILAERYYPNEKLFDVDKWFNPEYVEVFDNTEDNMYENDILLDDNYYFEEED